MDDGSSTLSGEVKLNIAKIRYVWAGLIVVLALGYFKALYPLPAAAAAEVVNSISALTPSMDPMVLNATRDRLEREFQKDWLLGSVMIVLGLMVAATILKPKVSTRRIVCTVLASSAFVGLYVANYIDFASEDTIVSAIVTKAELLSTLIRVTPFWSKVNWLHEMLSILCMFATLAVAFPILLRLLLIDKSKNQLKSSNSN